MKAIVSQRRTATGKWRLVFCHRKQQMPLCYKAGQRNDAALYYTQLQTIKWHASHVSMLIVQELSYPANSLSSMVVISAHLSTGTNAGRPVRCKAARNIADALAYGILRKLWSFCGFETVGLPDCVVLPFRSCNLRISTPRSYTTTSRFATIT